MKRAFVAIAAAVLMAACGASSQSATAEAPPNTDPRVGPVILWGGSPRSYHTEKQCDGTTLIYSQTVMNGGGIAAILDSPECK
jgi:hypothetical protein